MKTSIKLLIRTLQVLFVGAVLVPSFAFAQSTQTATGCLPNPLNVSSISDLLYLAVDIATYVGVVLAVIFLIYAGFKYIAAQGNQAKITEAHHFLLAVVIGIAILIGASAIVNVVENTLTSAGLVNSSTFSAPNSSANSSTGCTSTSNTTSSGSVAPANNTTSNTNSGASASPGGFTPGGGTTGGGGAGGSW